MTTEVTLSCEPRPARGKGAARRLRKTGLVPAVVYSGGKEATPIALNPLELARAISGPHKRNTLLTLEVKGGGSKKAMVKDLQKDVILRTPTHVDFVELDLQQPVEVRVPFVPTGKSKAVTAGAKMQAVVRTLRVKTLPTNIPTQIEMDTTPYDFGAYRAKDVPMPEGVTLLDDPMLTVVTIARPRGEAEEAPAAAAPAAAAAAAPAAG